MSAKRVSDVSSDYTDVTEHVATNSEVQRIKRAASRLQTGKLERDVDALLRSKGVGLNDVVGARRLGRGSRRTQG